MTLFRPALVLLLAAAVAGCGWNRGPKIPTTLEPKGGYHDERKDWRTLMPAVTGLEVAPTTTGAIVRATGETPTQGWWGAELLPENDGQPVDGVITYRFVVARPLPGSVNAQTVSTPQSRRVEVAAFIKANRFAATRKVVVIGADGGRSVGR